jgi:hypothetical protein
MLPELLRSLTLRCPRWARSLGLAHEQVAITYRHRRHRDAWAPHLAASRAAILDGAARCRGRRLACVIGAGDCLDVPVRELTECFERVVLTDVVLSPEAQRLARQSRGQIRAEIWDATGALSALADAPGTLTLEQATALFAQADPELPPGGEPDLVVSANCISQLGVVPVQRLAGVDGDAAAAQRCAAAASQRHWQWLAARPGVRVLLGDRTRLDLSPTEHELNRESVPGMEGLRASDRTWRWWLAPIPELSSDYHRVHEVGAWIDGPHL